MTSPGYDPDFARRVRTANAALGDHPEQALTLANSDLDEADINIVGGFTRTLENSQLVSLARLSGARTELSAEERSQLDAMGVSYEDVNEQPDNDERNWLERIFDAGASALANTGEFLGNVPGVSELFHGMMWLNNAAKLPARLISDGFDGGENKDEREDAMRAGGYDVNSTWDYIQFMTTQGQSLYHDLDGIRETFGDKLVDLAVEQQHDPEKFAENFYERDEETQALLQSDEFAEVADMVDRQHISPGRDIARILLPKSWEDDKQFTAISGFVDGAYTLILDPTLMVGKAAAGARALDAAGDAIRVTRAEAAATGGSRRGPSMLDRATGVTALTRGLDRATGGRFRMGLRDAHDVEGIRSLLAYKTDEAGEIVRDAAGNGVAATSVGAGVQSFLNLVKEFDEAVEPATQAAIYAQIRGRHRDLLPLFDEVRGHRILTPKPSVAWQQADEAATPIDEFAELQQLSGVQHALNTTTRTTDKAGRKLRERWNPAGRGRQTTQYGGEVVKKGSKWELRQNGELVGSFRTMKEAKAAHRGEPFEPEYFTPAGPATHSLSDVDYAVTDINNIGQIATNGAPIRTLDEFAEYFANTTGMIRLAHGVAARRELFLPGRVALRQRLAGEWARRRQIRGGKRNDRIYDHSRPERNIPDEIEEPFQAALDDVERLRTTGVIDEAEAARRGDAIHDEIRANWFTIKRHRARWEARNRRFVSLLPSVQAIDLTHAGSLEQVNRFARLYMNKTEADRLTAIYAAGDLGRRKAVLNGIIEQTFHASGLSRSEAGIKFMEKYRADRLAHEKQAYGLSRTDVIKTEAGEIRAALLPSQLNNYVRLPDFRSIQHLASKFAVGGALTRAGHIRAIATSETVDAVSGAVKQLWITTPAGGVRNALDEVANVALRGEAASLLQGRLVHSIAKRSAKATKREAERAAVLQTSLWSSIPRALRGTPRTINDVFLTRVLGRFMSMTSRPIDDLAIKHADELRELDQAGLLDRVVTGSYHVNDAIDPNAEALAAHAVGMHAKEVKYNGANVKWELDGWKQVEIDGGVGLDNWANNLGMAFQDLTSPAHVALRAILAGDDAVLNVVEYMQTPVMRHFLRDGQAFHYTKSGRPVQSAEDQLNAIEQYAENLVAHVTMLTAGKGAVRNADEVDELAGIKPKYEFDVSQPNWWLDEGVTPGPINDDLAEMLLRGDIPDRAWIKANLTSEQLPSHAIAKVFLPVNPEHKAGQILQGFTRMMATGYEHVVTKPIRAISRNPMLTVAYDQARRNLSRYEAHLVDNGFTPEIAEQIAQRAALRQAEQLVIKSIDDPTQATQYSMLARNIHAFARAQMDWLRRWGRTIRDNPELLQRGQLYLHGGETSGFVELDDDGHLQFTYPGSGQIVNLIGRVASLLPGVDNPVTFPMVPDFTSRLTFLNPSLDNPVGFSAMPLISIPFDFIMGSTGSDHALLKSSLDRAINGELGAGREWYEKILPSWANRLYEGVINDEDPASQYAQAWKAALANLDAAGRIPPPDASPSEIANFQQELNAQIQNQMVLRVLFGFVAPASPSLPTNDVAIDNSARIALAEQFGDEEEAALLRERDGEMVLTPDYVWQKAGIGSLKDEARVIFGQLPWEEALVAWVRDHPGELAFMPTGATAGTIVGESEAQANASIGAMKWMQENPYLLDQYGGTGGVAAYFIPQGANGETDYNQDAYRAQLESGIREYKDLDRYYTDLVIQRGEAIYYDTKDDYDAAITEAEASGNTLRVRELEDEWSAVKEHILGTNPLLNQKFAEYATSGVARERTVAELERMLSDPQAVRALGPQAGGVAEMLYAQRVYEAEREAVYGERGWFATSKREAAKAQFEAVIDDVVRRFPGLGDVARGAFRVPN